MWGTHPTQQQKSFVSSQVTCVSLPPPEERGNEVENTSDVQRFTVRPTQEQPKMSSGMSRLRKQADNDFLNRTHSSGEVPVLTLKLLISTHRFMALKRRLASQLRFVADKGTNGKNAHDREIFLPLADALRYYSHQWSTLSAIPSLALTSTSVLVFLAD